MRKKKLLLLLTVISIIGLVAAFYITNQQGSTDIRDKAQSGSQKTLKIMTYNILYNGQTDTRLDDIADYIYDNSVDIIGFQEAWGFKNDGKKWDGWKDRKDTLEYIKGKLNENGWTIYQAGKYGEDRDVGILSKYPIIATEEITHGIYAEVQFDNDIVGIYNVHLPVKKTTIESCNNLEIVLNNAQGKNQDIYFVIGDYNLGSWPQCYKEILDTYIEACDPLIDKSCEDTVNDTVFNRFENHGVIVRAIDHILFDRGAYWTVEKSFAGNSMEVGQSDHFPVIAEVKRDIPNTGENIVYNNSFEYGTRGWFRSGDINPSNFQTIKTQGSKDGVYSIAMSKLDDGMSPLDPYAVTKWIEVGESVSDKSFNLSFYIKSQSTGKVVSNIGIQSSPKNGNWSEGNTEYKSIGNITVSNSWTFIDKVIKFNDANLTSKVRVVIRVPEDGSEVHYDKVILKRVSDQCITNCTGRQCGDDGCGGSCGSCEENQTCNSSGMCIEECTPDCSGKVCGSDGCGGSCGSCSGSDVCINGQCNCVSNCSSKQCGDDDGCGGKCTSCESGYTCSTSTWRCETGECIPDCEGKQCGDNGCGESCGSCSEGEICIDVSCQVIDYTCDIDGDGNVNMLDLAIIQNNWGWEGDSLDQEADLNKDRKVNMLDMAAIINNWTKKY